MIHRKSLFRVALAAADAAFGVGLLVFSAAVYGGSPVLMVIGLLYFITGSRVLAYLRMRGFLVAIGALSAATAYAAAAAGLPLRDAAPLFSLLAALFAANLAYALRLGAPRL